MGQNGPMDEFQFLPAQARDIDSDRVPPVRRLSFDLPDGRSVSGLHYGDPVSGAFTPPVVTFLHGAGLNAHTWDTTVIALGLPALALDLPGHGDSSWRDDAAYTGRHLAQDIAEVVAAWTHGPQVLVGQSLGGLTAAALAASRPDLVRELVIVDISPGIDPNGGASQIAAFFAGPTDWATRDELVERAVEFGLGGTREAATRGVFLNSRIRPDGRVEWKHHFAHLAAAMAEDPLAAQSARQGHDALRGVLAASGWEDLATVRAPLTLVYGERGFLTAQDVADYRTKNAEATIIAVASGHNVQEEAPRELAAIVAAIAGADSGKN